MEIVKRVSGTITRYIVITIYYSDSTTLLRITLTFRTTLYKM